MSIRVQHPAPDFRCEAVVEGAFKDVSLSHYRGKYVVLFFYPLDFTFVCPTEILAFDEKLDQFRALGAELLAASVDSKYSHLAWTNTPRTDGGIKGVRLPLLADVTKRLASDYGVLADEGEDEGQALRGLFIIDKEGILRHMLINDISIGRSVDEALRTLQAIQFHDAHGDVCPANWHPGSDTMRDDPKGSQAYFKKHG